MHTQNSPLEWTRKTARLRFNIGEYCVGRWSFRVMAPLLHYSRMAAKPSAEVLPEMPSGVDAILFPSHPAPDPEPRLRFVGGKLRYIPFQVPRYRVDLGGDFNAYLAAAKQKAAVSGGWKPRHNLARSVAKFAEFSGGKIDFREYTTPEGAAEFHRLATEISRETYQAKLLQTGLPDTPEFRAELVDLARQGLLHGYLMAHENIPVAFAYCFQDGDYLSYETIGYNREYKRWSPGTILLYLILEQQFARKQFAALDFGEGEAQYKDYFATGYLRCADVYYFRPTPVNVAALGIHNSLFYLNRAFVLLLGKLKLRERVKAAIRRRAAGRHSEPPAAAAEV